MPAWQDRRLLLYEASDPTLVRGCKGKFQRPSRLPMAVALWTATLSVGIAITYPHNVVPTSSAAMFSLFPASPAALHDQRHTVVRMAVATRQTSTLQELERSRTPPSPERLASLLRDEYPRLAQRDIGSLMGKMKRAGRWEHVVALLRCAEQETGATQIMYNMAISACGKSGDWMESLRLLSVMRARGLAPDDFSYGAALSACANAAQWEESLAILDTAMVNESPPTTLRLGVFTAYCMLHDSLADGPLLEATVAPNAICFNSAIDACARAGRSDEAIELLQRMTAAGVAPNEISYTTAIKACEKAGQAERAVQLLSEMRSRGVEPGTRSYSAAISACEKGRDWQAAARVLAEMREHGVKMDAIASKAAILTLCKAGEVRAALALLPTIDLDALGGEAYSVLFALSQAAGENGMQRVASRIEEEMRRRGLTTSAAAAKVTEATWLPPRRRSAPSMAGSAAAATRRTTRSGDSGDATSKLTRRLVEEMRARTAYDFDPSALPHLFVRNSTVAQQRKALTFHADKKALAAALAEADSGPQVPLPSVHVKVSIKMCVDCHEFFKQASKMLQRRIICDDGSHHHVFDDGECSCGDRWR